MTDPPAGIAFMGKDWDKDKGGRDHWVAWMAEVMRECLRVLKPGGHAFVWALPRTSHWTATALEDAGFEVRDVVTHVFGSGFPKSLDVSKAIDKAAGAEREVVGQKKTCKGDSGTQTYAALGAFNQSKFVDVTAPSTDLAKQWQGWGTALKPASEHWILCRKPLGEKTVARNVERFGTGAINVDASRIDALRPAASFSAPDIRGNAFNSERDKRHVMTQPENLGRFPANFVLSHNPDCELAGNRKVKASRKNADQNEIKDADTTFGQVTSNKITTNYGNKDGTETVEAWQCTDGCAVAELDRQSGHLHGAGNKTTRKAGVGKPSNSMFGPEGGAPTTLYDRGGTASRFFYVAKASRRERNEGCEGLPTKAQGAYGEFAGDGRGRQTEHTPTTNHHPTVKPQKLMTYLIRMITPPGGTVLDPFAGSGSTGVAAKAEGFSFIGIEREPEYVAIAKARLGHVP